jgi:chromate transporter
VSEALPEPEEPAAATVSAGERRGEATYSLAQMTAYALKLGAIGFGGPIALAEYMHRDLVEDRGWLTQDDYDEGLALAQLAPGPLAGQLAIYLGYAHYGIPGASLVGVAFVLPSFLMVVAFAAVYVRLGEAAWVQGIFYTVGAAIIGMIANSAQRLTRRIVGRNPLLAAIWLTLAVTTFITERESIPLIVLAGVLVWAVRAPPQVIHRSVAALARAVRRGPSALLPTLGLPRTPMLAAQNTPSSELVDIGTFFVKAGAFVFGSGLAIVPFLFGGVVHGQQWLTEQQFLDAVAVALISPGPVVITTAFIGYLVEGLPGAALAAFATFFPSYLFTVIPAPLLRRYGQRPALTAVIDGVTAAAVGAIVGAVLVLGERAIVDPVTALIAVSVLVLLVRGRPKVPEPAIVLVAAILGLVFHLTGV